jgi:ABC-type nitrate/sulfonate/bicarbonate transport system ATPase subunit
MHPVPALSIDHVSATYRDGGRTLDALIDISVSVADGEFVALVGPSGSGKSTLLDIVSGLFSEIAGSVALEGAITPPGERPGRSAYMRQRDLLMPWRTAVQNAALAMEARGMPRQQARATARARFPEFGLEGFEDARPAQLSGGMRQRIAFLRTILAGPRLLLLDEPFGALDALNRVTMQAWLANHLERDPHPTLLVTHDIDEAIVLADRVLVMSPRPGRIVHEERISFPRPRNHNIAALPAYQAHRTRLLAALGLIDAEVAP